VNQHRLVSRRAVMGFGIAAGLAGTAVLASCRVYGTTGAAPSTSPGPSGGSGGGGGGKTALAQTSQIPVGGGKIFGGADAVVTQPTAGQFKCFSATCTHAGCTVGDVSDGTINCPCHGSKYRIADGSVAHGPATAPLPSKSITVTGTTITLT
jgi:nitrite reductase/ring-hydroxylating ferredoxin subunit